LEAENLNQVAPFASVSPEGFIADGITVAGERKRSQLKTEN
jgi:hypothetical protein